MTHNSANYEEQPSIQPLVSIVVPTYNRSDLLKEAITSVLDQDYPEWEMLVVNDGSTDDTQELLESYSDEVRIRPFYQENSGQAKARNHGLDKARGEYVAFLDSDNLWLPNKLRQQVDFLRESPDIDVLYSDIQAIDLAGEIVETQDQMRRYSGIVWRQLMVDNFVNFNTAVARRSKLIAIGGFNENLRCADDYDLWLRLSVQSSFHYLPIVCAQYRVMGERISDNLDGRYDSNFGSVQRLIDSNPRLLSDREKRDIQSRIHQRFARAYHSRGQRRKAITIAAMALRQTPMSKSAWRTFFAILVKGSPKVFRA